MQSKERPDGDEGRVFEEVGLQLSAEHPKHVSRQKGGEARARRWVELLSPSSLQDQPGPPLCSSPIWDFTHAVPLNQKVLSLTSLGKLFLQVTVKWSLLL